MIIFPITLPWLPTSEDREKWLKEDKQRANAQYPIEFSKMIEESNLSTEYLLKLEETFTKEQKELYLKAKLHAQNSVFHSGRTEFLAKEMNK